MRRAIGVEGVTLGELWYRQARIESGLPALPSTTKIEARKRPHPYWDIGVQAYIVTAWMSDVNQIAAASAAMAYMLHDLDDIADRLLPSFFSQLTFSEFRVSPEEFLLSHFPHGYSELYKKIKAIVRKWIPGFDEKAFDKATLRMIRGSVLLSERVLRADREKFQRWNKLEHLRLIRKHPGLFRFLRDEVSNVFYSYTVKSLPDGIFSFYEHAPMGFDPGLMVVFGILAAPGLVLENISMERSIGEFGQDGVVSMEELLRTCERAQIELVKSIESREFDRAQLEAFLTVYRVYGDAFGSILKNSRVWDSYEKSLYEIQEAVDRLDRSI